MNRNILTRSIEALALLSKYAQWQVNEGSGYHPTLPSALSKADSVLADARMKSTVAQTIDGKDYEIEPCRWCGSQPRFKEAPGNAFGFNCTCGGKRYIQTYYNSKIHGRTGRIESAVEAWNGYPVEVSKETQVA